MMSNQWHEAGELPNGKPSGRPSFLEVKWKYWFCREPEVKAYVLWEATFIALFREHNGTVGIPLEINAFFIHLILSITKLQKLTTYLNFLIACFFRTNDHSNYWAPHDKQIWRGPMGGQVSKWTPTEWLKRFQDSRLFPEEILQPVRFPNVRDSVSGVITYLPALTRSAALAVR